MDVLFPWTDTRSVQLLKIIAVSNNNRELLLQKAMENRNDICNIIRMLLASFFFLILFPQSLR